MKEPPVRIMADGQPGQMYDSLTDGGGKIVVSCHRDYQVSPSRPHPPPPVVGRLS